MFRKWTRFIESEPSADRRALVDGSSGERGIPLQKHRGLVYGSGECGTERCGDWWEECGTCDTRGRHGKVKIFQTSNRTAYGVTESKKAQKWMMLGLKNMKKKPNNYYEL